jgi:hypothetical protein
LPFGFVSRYIDSKAVDSVQWQRQAWWQSNKFDTF